MHNTIDFPEIPKIPKAPNEKKFNNRKKYEEALERYNKKKENYNRDLQNYKLSVRLKPFSTFHHLFVLYDGNSKEPNFIRWKKYMEADIQNKWLQELYKIELENENKND